MVRVLIVEDDAAIRETLAALLRSETVDVTHCEGACQAADLLPSGNYDIVITDMRMETSTSGRDVIRAANAAGSAPRVVVLTAFPLPRNSSLADGASAVLLKGTDVASLIGKIRDIVAEVVSFKQRSRTA